MSIEESLPGGAYNLIETGNGHFAKSGEAQPSCCLCQGGWVWNQDSSVSQRVCLLFLSHTSLWPQFLPSQPDREDPQRHRESPGRRAGMGRRSPPSCLLRACSFPCWLIWEPCSPTVTPREGRGDEMSREEIKTTATLLNRPWGKNNNST